ncbi:hypothetical protein BEH94_03505 [Candidatus Altiarchaeales archaeon WOR_SM1_SCG]|nr:hypothetical protein BEH94_03505 [Candidatus Altiarchaeales archaeon WOR_SM1_SCG]
MNEGKTIPYTERIKTKLTRYDILADKIKIANDSATVNILKFKKTGVHYIELRRKDIGGFTVNLRIDEAVNLSNITDEDLKKINQYSLPADKRKKRIKIYPKIPLSTGKTTCFIQKDDKTELYKLKKYDVNLCQWRSTKINLEIIKDLHDLLQQFGFTNNNGELKSQYKNF